MWSKEIKEEIYNLEKIAEKLRENDAECDRKNLGRVGRDIASISI